MQFPTWFKYLWWAVIIMLCGSLIYLRRDVIISGSPQTFDALLIAITAALLLIPFFSEITILGVTIKQRIDEAKKEIKEDVKEQVDSVRAELQSIVNVNNRFAQQLVIGTYPTPDNQLTTLEEQIRPILDGFRQELGLTNQPQPLQNLVPSEDIVLAFASRYQIERELTRLWSNRFQSDSDRLRGRPVGRMVDDLVEAQVIPPAIGRSIREVHAISSPAVHGVEPSPEKMSFLKDVVPSLVATLKAVQ